MDRQDDDPSSSVTLERIRQIEEKAFRALRGPRCGETPPRGPYRFQPVETQHLPLISHWLARPHVAQWWSDPDEQIEKLRRNLVGRSFEALIMLLDGRPIGYLQVYDASPDSPDASLDQPLGTRGIDFLIGEETYLGKGHGAAFVRLITERRLAERSVHRVIADPHPTNLRSIRCFEAAGFRRAGEACPPWGPVILMIRDKQRDDL